MDRSTYLNESKEKFYSNNLSLNSLESFDIVVGIYSVISYKIIDKPHPNYPDFPKIILVKANWKPNVSDEFLSELEFLFDFTPLLKNFKDSGIKINLVEYGMEELIEFLIHGFSLRDFNVSDINNGIKWEFLYKTNSVIVFSNLTLENNAIEKNSVITNNRIHPRPILENLNNSDEVNIVYILKGSDRNNTEILFPGYKIKEIESSNYIDAFNNEWLSSLYYLSLNSLRTRLGLTMAVTVPVEGYYKIHTIRLDDPRKDSNDTPLAYDMPYQIIGIGNWMSLKQENDFKFDFKEQYSFEIRLNPLFNISAIISGLDNNFPRIKKWDSFYSLANQRYIKINEVSFDSGSYVFNWEAVLINRKIEKTQ